MHKRDYTLDDYVQAFNDLYITERKKHIQQRQKDKIVNGEVISKKGSYSHISTYNLGDGIVKQHLQGKKTVGIFAGGTFTKFLTFDVDFDENIKKAEHVTRELVVVLEEKYKIRYEQILVSFSGSKGYHVTVFFDELIKNKLIEDFYNVVREDLGYSKREIELRPTAGNGVKLPLSINWKTGNRQYLVNPYTLKQIPDDEIFKVEKINTAEFKDFLEIEYEIMDRKLTIKQKKEFKKVVEKTNLDIPVNFEENMMKMLEENRLMYPDSRHDSTRHLLTFLSQQGYSKEDAISIVQAVIRNTYENHRDMIDSTRTLKYCLDEVERLWEYSSKYNTGYVAKKTIRVYEDEIIKVLTPKRIHLKHLLFILLVHSKRHAKRKDGTFFMTYKQMGDYGSTKNWGRLVKYVDELEEMGLITIVARKRKQKDSEYLLPNIYRVNIHYESENFIDLDIQAETELEFEKTVAKLIPSNEIKQYIPRRQWDNTFKHYYAS